MFQTAFQINAFQNNAFQIFITPTNVKTGGDIAYDAQDNEVTYDKFAVEAYIAACLAVKAKYPK
jgi:hypothetical protein